MIGQDVYAALQEKMPGKNNSELADVVGLAHSTVSKMAKGECQGVKAARWLKKEDSKYAELVPLAVNEGSNNKKEGYVKREKTKGKRKKTRMDRLPDNLKFWCGYIG